MESHFVRPPEATVLLSNSLLIRMELSDVALTTKSPYKLRISYG